LSVVFFTDRDLGLQFPSILTAAGLQVRRHADLFPHDCPDEEWLSDVASHGWIALTHDAKIRYKPNELAAVMENGLALLVLVGKAPYSELARSFVATLNPVLAFLATHPPPVIGKVYRASPAALSRNAAAQGRIELWHPKP
jgi:hypothetical protein